MMNSAFSINPLIWDSEYFGIHAAQLVFHKQVEKQHINTIFDKLKAYEFVVIKNPNELFYNTQLIGQLSGAFLADINIQLSKKLNYNSMSQNSIIPSDIKIGKTEDFNLESLIPISQFNFSRFFDDERLRVRGGDKLYHQWLLNSKGVDNKYLLVHQEEELIYSYLLFNIQNQIATIELIVVNPDVTSKGLGSKLYQTFENYLASQKVIQINVGTQLSNIIALNFYHKMGFKQISSMHVYHLWQ